MTRRPLTLAELRQEYALESYIDRLATTRPPVTHEIERSVDSRGEEHFTVVDLEEDPSALGYTVSGELLDLIGSFAADGPRYGRRHPLRAAMTEWERTCRRRHRIVPGRSSYLDHADGPLCADILWAAIRDLDEIPTLCRRHQLSPETIESTLARGIAYLDGALQRMEDRQPGHDPELCDVCQGRVA